MVVVVAVKFSRCRPLGLLEHVRHWWSGAVASPQQGHSSALPSVWSSLTGDICFSLSATASPHSLSGLGRSAAAGGAVHDGSGAQPTGRASWRGRLATAGRCARHPGSIRVTLERGVGGWGGQIGWGGGWRAGLPDLQARGGHLGQQTLAAGRSNSAQRSSAGWGKVGGGQEQGFRIQQFV
jgi:hypothetical protein